MTPVPEPSLPPAIPPATPLPPGLVFPEVEVQQKPTRIKRRIACNYCRAKKIRCNGADPCANCVDHDQSCTWTAKRRSRPKIRENEVNMVIERLAAVEAMVQASAPSQRSPVTAVSAPSPGCSPTIAQAQSDGGASRMQSCPASNSSPTEVAPAYSFDSPVASVVSGKRQDWFSPAASLRPPRQVQEMAVLPHSQPTFPPAFSHRSSFDHGSSTSDSAPPASYCTSIPGDAGGSPDERRERGSICSSATSHWEYHGPRSYLSICSKPGIQWVSERTGSSNFHDVATSFTTDTTRWLKVGKKLSKEIKPEPDPETAWKYTRAYFEEALDAALGIVHRPWFESRLKAHISSPSSDEDPSWYALRNIIYASGCRIVLSKHATFQEANRSAWEWFENALSVHTEILYFRTSLVGVQALTLMAYFTENLGNPCLEYMLCTNALRLAVSKGLHRQLVSSWSLTQDERCHWNWVFWAAYCLEKHIVHQSGRPSIIDDDDINCQVPTVAPPSSSVNLFYCNTLIRLAQLSSLVAKRLSSVQAFRQGPEALVRTVGELNEKLVVIKRSIEPILSLSDPLDLSKLPHSVSFQQAVYLQYTYYNTVFDIHTVLTYPWSQSILGLTQHPALRTQVERSTEMVARSCRDAILATKHICIAACTPLPLTFFSPAYAIINLFIHILQNPSHPNVRSDVALMDIGVGHFARLEFATNSEISVPFMKEMAALTRDAIRYRRSDGLRNSSECAASGVRKDLSTAPDSQGMADGRATQIPVHSGQEDFPWSNDGLADDPLDLDLGNWSMLLPIPHFGDDIESFLGP
ncbi:hypothetical protein MKZ38_004877 [Zalerion maritima]|uniref:Zn(2)-C6 fungal-type domain-containing protein n=1 Tax=Zalerion maritima TaxID=339359 RepID=A0AAD5RWC1_9PEZI|nr:hypothetical protein MKZ38_004877 [Zalerion maritima]